MAKKVWKEKRATSEARMELTEHLDELRDRLIWSLLALAAGVLFVGFPLNGVALDILQEPVRAVPTAAERQRLRVEVAPDGTLRMDAESLAALLGSAGELRSEAWDVSRLDLALPDGTARAWGVDFRNQLFFFDPLEPIVMRFKIAFLLGLIAALPVVGWNVWAFVAPGLTPGERRFMRPLLGFALVLFPAGAAFAYFFLKYALYFLFKYGGDFTPALGLKTFLSFEATLMLVMGAVFEFPVVALALTRLGVLSPEAMASNRPHVVVGLMFFSAVVTPPDPFTMVAMGLPLWILFELSLLLARLPMFRPPASGGA